MIGLSGSKMKGPGEITSSKMQRLGALHLRQSAHLLEHLRRQIAVDLDQGHRRAAGRFAADVEGGDVDARLAQVEEKRPIKPGLSRLVM